MLRVAEHLDVDDLAAGGEVERQRAQRNVPFAGRRGDPDLAGADDRRRPAAAGHRGLPGHVAGFAPLDRHAGRGRVSLAAGPAELRPVVLGVYRWAEQRGQGDEDEGAHQGIYAGGAVCVSPFACCGGGAGAGILRVSPCPVGGRSTVGHVALDHVIGVRIPASQPPASAAR